jgi:4'-phosphopantetheinyl transferase
VNVGVFFVSSDVEAAELSEYQSVLTAAERARAMRYRFEDDRRRAIVSRGALRILLPKYVEETIDIIEAPGGKPHLGSGGIEFNVSHSGSIVALAFADAPVGIDLERRRTMEDDAHRIARRHFSQAEITRLAAATSTDEEFFAIWTAKEAVVKAAGIGLVASLESFTVPVASEEFQPVAGLGEWSVRSLTTPRSGYHAALAVPSAAAALASVTVAEWRLL